MKKIFIITIATIVALGLASCTKDTFVKTDNAALSFSLSVDNPTNASITYANIATANEWTINSIDIYVFDDEGVFNGKLTEATDYNKTTNGPTTTIRMSPNWVQNNIGATLKFYFVANDRDGLLGATNAPHINNFAGTEEDFIMLTTNRLVQTSPSSEEYMHIKAPLLFSGSSSLVTITNETVLEELTIKRREARFDIINNIGPRFVINQIFISRAIPQAYIFAEGEALGDEMYDYVAMEEISGPINHVIENGQNIAQSVFYLYPTYRNPVILIRATIDGGYEHIFPVYPGESGISKIEANKRYKIVASHDYITWEKIVFNFVVADYDEGDSIDFAPTDQDDNDDDEGGVTIPTEGIPAFENILAVDANGVLHLNGQNIDANGIGGGYTVSFKWGSVIAISSKLPYHTYVAWVPPGYTGPMHDFNDIPSGYNATGKGYWPVGSSILENNPARVTAGYGDPCQLAVKDGYNVGDFVMPKGNPYNQMGTEDATQTASRFTAWTQVNNITGRWYNENVTTGDIAFRAQFYPYTGYWSRQSGYDSNNRAYYLGVDYSVVSEIRDRNNDMSIRCIPKDY